MCKFCEIVNVEPDSFDENEANRFIKAVYDGSINSRNLDLKSYLRTADKLTDGVYKGFGKNINDVLYLSEDYQMLYALRDNVYIFSGAKQYQQVMQMSSFLTDNGKIAPFNEFKKAATSVYREYNINYLNAEYNSAIAQSRTASQWMDIEKEKGLFPYLQYQTAGDGRVRPEHASLNNIIKKVDDPFWSKYMPPNGWNCRCDVIQLDEGVVTDTKNLVVENVPKEFMFNAGKEKVVFSEEHPYFDIAPKDKNFAKTNFGMPMPNEVSQIKVDDYTKKQSDWEKNLSTKKKEDIDSYTRTDYKSLNYYLRTNKTLSSTTSDVWDSFNVDLQDALKDAPKYEGTTYRGMRMSLEEKDIFMKSISEGNIFTEKAFMSTTKDELIAKERFGKAKDSVFFEIKGKSGVDITNLSSSKQESEILFTPNTKHLIEKVIELGDGNIKIVLKEL
jgi:SPP1 gp7 family putative phage head morphogenesis protein